MIDKKEHPLKGVLPVNDGTIFVDSDGLIAECIGLAFCEDDFGFIETKFISDDYYVCELADDDYPANIIGKRGDTIHVKDIGLVLKKGIEYDGLSIKEDLEKYFTLDLSDAPDTLDLAFYLYRYEGVNGIARLKVLTPGFPDIDFCEYDVTKEDLKLDSDNDFYQSFSDTYLYVLKNYSDIIGRRVKVNVFFQKCLHDIYGRNLEQLNKEICKYEDKYLPRIRKYIDQELDKLFQLDKIEADKQKAIETEIEQNKNRFISKYDLDPQLGKK